MGLNPWAAILMIAIVFLTAIVVRGFEDRPQCRSGYWLQGAADRGLKHICWDGCMFPNAMLETQSTWNTILGAMIKVREAHGWG